jgi:hypothetical protein
VVLVDFGLAGDVASVAGAVGTKAYMAPEQAAGSPAGCAADWYGVGVLLYQALTGHLPFRGAGAARSKANGTIEPIRRHFADAPDDLVALCEALLDVDPAARPTGHEVLGRLGGDAMPRASARADFVGRRDELLLLRRAVADSRSRPVTVVVEGESGVGKTALVRRFVRDPELAAAGALVFSGRCYERELVPYKAFDGIVDALSEHLAGLDPSACGRLVPPHAALLARVFPVLRRVPAFAGLEPPAPADPREQRAQAFAALRAVLAALARDRPVILAIDDLHWADADSHRLLSDLLRAPDAPSVCVIATARPMDGGAFDPLADPLAHGDASDRLEDTRQISLGPLSKADAWHLAAAGVHQALGHAPDAGVASSIVAEACGHPLFLLTLARHAARPGAAGVHDVKLDDALFERIQSTDPTARRILELVAVAGGLLAADAAAAAASLDRAAFATAVGTLRAEHLVRTTRALGHDFVEPYHDRVRESLLARIGSEAVSACHRRLVDGLVATGRGAHDPQALVRHLEGGGDLEGAASQAEIAGARALEALAFDRAAEMFRAALRLGGHDAAGRQALRVRIAEALANAGRGADAGEAYLEAVGGAVDAGERLELRRHAADHWLRSGHIDRGMAILGDVVREIGDRFPSQREAVVRTLLRRLRTTARGLRWSPVTPGQVAPATLRRIDAYHAIGVSLALIDPARGGAFEAQAVHLALDAGEPRRLAAALAMETGYSASTGTRGIARGRRLLGEVDRIARMTGDPYAGAVHLLLDGFVDYHAGQFHRAVAKLREAESVLQGQVGTHFEQVFCRCFRLISMRYGGRFGELARGFSDWIRAAEQRDDRFSEAALRFNLNGVWLVRDQPDEARRDLARTRWIPPAGGYHMQHWYEAQARFEIDLYAGDAPEGRRRFRPVLEALSRSLILRMRIHRVHVRWLEARLELAASPPGGADRRAARIGRALSREDVPYAQTYARLVRAAIEHRRGRTARATALLEEAAAHADCHEYAHCASAARWRLGELVGGARGHALVEGARAWMLEQSIRRPECMVAVWAPGFGGEARA